MAMKTIACTVFVLVFISAGFSAVTMEQAAEKASDYAFKGESVDIKPQAKTFVGNDEYWVIELNYMGKIIVMIPINANSGEVVTDDSVLPALKTHYLANYFATDDTISNFLETTLTYAQGRKTAHQNALNQFQVQEPKIPADANLEKYSALKDSLSRTIADNNDLRTSQIIPSQSAISSITKEEDIQSAQSALSGVFVSEDVFLTDIESLSTDANAFIAELGSNAVMSEAENSAVQAALTSIANNLVEDVTARKDTLSQNKGAIDAFFSSLDSKAGDYLLKLQQRINDTGDNQLQEQVFEKLQNITNNAKYVFDNSQDIPATYQDKIDELTTLLNETQQYYTDGDYAKTEENFEKLNALIEELKAAIGTAPDCTGGKEWDGSACVCPDGTTEDSTGTCVSSGGGFQLNWPLIGGLGAIIVVIVLFKLRGSGGNKEEEQSGSDQWQSYGWK